MEAVIIERGSTMKQMVTWSISLTEPFPAPCRGSRCTRLSDEVNNPSGRFWVSSPLRVDQKASLNKGTVIFSFSRPNFLFVFLQIYRQSLQWGKLSLHVQKLSPRVRTVTLISFLVLSFLCGHESWPRLTGEILNLGSRNHNIPAENYSLQGATLISPLSHLAYGRGGDHPSALKVARRWSSLKYLQKPQMPKVFNASFLHTNVSRFKVKVSTPVSSSTWTTREIRSRKTPQPISMVCMM